MNSIQTKSLPAALLAVTVILKLADATYLIQQQQQQQQQMFASKESNPFASNQIQAPTINPFYDSNVLEGQRSSITCSLSGGELPVTISWLKDDQLLTPQIAQSKKIIIRPDSDDSSLKFTSVKLEHAGNYTCVAKNRVGIQTHSARLIVHVEPRWVKEPHHEPIVAIRGQTVVIDCQTYGYPKPQQTWQIKTNQQSEFENIIPSVGSKISISPNGSLIIKQADKSDEANYLCKSFNGIGKGITWSTSLKVNVPAHFESTRQQTSLVRKQNQVQLRCDAFGDEPITIEWFKNKQRLSNELEGRFSIHNTPRQNGLISILIIKQAQRQDNSLYECITRNQVGKDRLPIELMVQEEPDNIQELQATQINSRSVTLMWTEPYDGKSSITSYMFQYKKVIDSSSFNVPASIGDFDLVSGSSSSLMMMNQDQADSSMTKTTADDWQQASRITLPISQQQQVSSGNSTIRSITIEKLEPSTKYVLRALAINQIGQSKFSQPMEFVTEEEAPEMGPTNIKASAINSTSILVSWDELPKSKQPGRIHGYYIGYRPASANNTSSQPNFTYKPYIINDLVASLASHIQHQHHNHHQHHHQQHHHHQQQQQHHNQQSASSHNLILMQDQPRLEFIIHDLRRDTNYEITVVAFNARGSSPSSDFVLCRTIEMEAPKPVKLSIRKESNESILIEWQRDPMDQNPVDDYVLYQEKNSASQVWTQRRLPGNQTQYKAAGLLCGTRYQFYIIAHNKVGKSLPSEVVGASTSGSLPAIPSKMSLIKLFNSTCLMVNLNSFQDNGCRIKTFTVRYRTEKTNLQPDVISGPSSAAAVAAASSGNLMNADGLIATHQALASVSNTIQSSQLMMATKQQAVSSSPQQQTSDWKTVRPRNQMPQQRAFEEDRIEYLCNLSPVGEYTIHVAALNDVGRSEIEYTVLMSSDELRYSFLRDVTELVHNLPNIFAYIPSILVFLLAGLFVSLASLILYTTIIRYYQKFVIMHNQIRATRRAKQDEKRRRKLNNSRHSQKLDLWADEYNEDEDDDGGDLNTNSNEHEADGDDENDEDEDEMTTVDNNSSTCSSSSSSGRRRQRALQQHQRQQQMQFLNSGSNHGHYISNLRGSNNFDGSSIGSPCNKFNNNNSACVSTASPDSIHGRFQCLNSKQYVKMNEYTMLPTITGQLQHNDIYGTTSAAGQAPAQSASSQLVNSQASNNSLYYSTLRRSSMQTYLPQQRRSHNHIQPLQQQRRSQNVADIYGYYMAPNQANGTGQPTQITGANQQQMVNQQEAVNSIFVPPQQIIYSAPNLRRQPPMFL